VKKARGKCGFKADEGFALLQTDRRLCARKINVAALN
jgi:hypothetical protein